MTKKKSSLNVAFYQLHYLALKIKGIVKTLSPGIYYSLYFDDFVIYYKSKHIHTINRQLQLCLNKIQRWAGANGLKVHVQNRVFTLLQTPHTSSRTKPYNK